MLSLISVKLLLGTSQPPSTAGVLAEGNAQHAHRSCHTGSTEHLSCTTVFPNLSCFHQFGALLTALMLFPLPGPCTGLHQLPKASPWDPSNPAPCPKPFVSWDHPSSAPRTKLISSLVLWGLCGAAEQDKLLGQGEVSCLKAPTPNLCSSGYPHSTSSSDSGGRWSRVGAHRGPSAPRHLRVLLNMTTENQNPKPTAGLGRPGCLLASGEAGWAHTEGQRRPWLCSARTRAGLRRVCLFLGPGPSRLCRPHAPCAQPPALIALMNREGGQLPAGSWCPPRRFRAASAGAARVSPRSSPRARLCPAPSGAPRAPPVPSRR